MARLPRQFCCLLLSKQRAQIAKNSADRWKFSRRGDLRRKIFCAILFPAGRDSSKRAIILAPLDRSQFCKMRSGIFLESVKFPCSGDNASKHNQAAAVHQHTERIASLSIEHKKGRCPWKDMARLNVIVRIAT